MQNEDEYQTAKNNASENLIEFNCPNCDVPLRVGEEHAGKYSMCPDCKKRILIPKSDGQK
jgi:hypothetical protein